MADNFDEDGPYGGQKVNVGDDRIRQNNRTLKASLELEHEPFDVNDEADGRHKFVTLQDQTGSEPTPAADEMALYSLAHGGQPELFVREESSGDIIQLTEAGYLYGVMSLLAGAPAAARKALADMILANTIAITGEIAAGGTYRNLIQMLVGDTIEVGDVNVDLAFQVADLANFEVDDGGGAHKILTDDDEGTLDAGTLDGIDSADFLGWDSDHFKESAELALTSAAVQETAHLFGSVPRLVLGFLRCKTGELGYAADDEIPFTSLHTDTAFHDGASVWADATNVGIQLGFFNNRFFVHKRSATAGTSVALTAGNWRAFARCWK